MKDHYKTLGVKSDASGAEIKHAYKKLALIFHPDVSKGKAPAEQFIEIKDAYETLMDKEKRATYDKALKEFYSNYASGPVTSTPFHHSDIPYAAGVPGTDTHYNNDVPHKKRSYTLWRVILWIIVLVIALARRAAHP